MKSRKKSAGTLEFERARRALSMDNTIAALACLERALGLEDNPSWYSYLGYCVAVQRGQVTRGMELCVTSLEREPDNGDHYLNLGRIHLVSGNKAGAVQAFREAMARGGSREIMEQLRDLGQRKPPVIRKLRRTNPLNRYLGMVLSRMGLR